MPHLLDLPDLAMTKIVEKLNFIDIQRLRRTSRDLFNFIEDSKPDSQLSQIDLKIERSSVDSSLYFGEENAHLRIEYDVRKNNELTALLWNEGRRSKWQSWEDSGDQFVEKAVKDLEPILINQKSKIRQLSIKFHQESHRHEETPESELNEISNRFLENFKEHFKAGSGIVKVGHFQTSVMNQEQVSEILPLLDPGSLKSLSIWNTVLRFSGSPDIFDVRKLAQLEQWKSLEWLCIMNFSVRVPVRTFFHIADVYVHYERITMDMVLEIKKAFLKSPHMIHFKIDYNTEEENFENSLMRHFGCHYRDFNQYGRQRKKWFYKIPENSDRVLFITVDLYRIVYERNREQNLPEGIVGE